MATLTIGGKTVFTQSGTDEPVLSSDITGTLGNNIVFPAGHPIQTKVYSEYPTALGNNDKNNGTITSSTSSNLITLKSTSNKVMITCFANFYCGNGSTSLGGYSWIFPYQADGTEPVVTGAYDVIGTRSNNLMGYTPHFYTTGGGHSYWLVPLIVFDESPNSLTPRYALVLQTHQSSSRSFNLAASSTFGVPVRWIIQEIQT